ncbi:MAG: DNA polymerase III subunit gamma/tau, partial [Nitrospiria bacterium]
MEYRVSARQWRPQTFEEVVGQRHVATVLRNAVRLQKIAHAYLFSGIRGVGKTSLARILAKAVNCAVTHRQEGEEIPCNRCDSCREITEGRSVDVLEIDGASNTGVDDVRELRERVKYLPLRGRYKIYIIDEVHMLSNAAFNALLKTLEEPPPHLIFILATTESHKIPATILSRCQHFTFRQIPRSEIVAQLRRVAQARKVRFTDQGLILIAKVAEGSMRDALTLLDQAITYGGEAVSDQDLFALLGRMGEGTFHLLVRAIHQKDADALLGLAGEIAEKGCDLRHFLADWMEHLRHLIVTQNVPEAATWIDHPAEEIEEIQTEAALFSREELQRLFSLFARLQGEIRNAPNPNLLFEVALMKAILLADLQPVEKILERLDALRGGGTGQDKRAPSGPKTSIKTIPHPPSVPSG